MNDNDIIKALEHCTSSTTSEACNGCPLFDTTICTEMENGLQIYALDLINRQKAEIERLTEENKRGFDKWLILEKRTKERYAEIYEEAKGVVRAEAIREFAERLISKYSTWHMDSEISVDMFVCDVKRLAKELTEGNNE